MEDTVWDALTEVFHSYHERQFLFVFDEWDYIFHQDFISDQDKKEYLRFLSNLLKDKGYVALAYMTGILPIAKYSSGSELNMFLEYTMATQEKFSDCFGFTDPEVDTLYEKYLTTESNPLITREGLRDWYDGYQTPTGIRIYNPHSVVCALCNNQLGNYWTSSGPYDEIYFYVSHNIAAVRDDLAMLTAEIPVPAKIREYAAVSMSLTTKDEIFSAMIVYGLLSYENGMVRIPNRELMEQFSAMLRKKPSLGYLYSLAQRSSKMLQATLHGEEAHVAKLLEYAHNIESPLLSYTETGLTVLVTLMYLSARDYYRIEREEKAGIGYADFIFYPETDPTADGIILELKVDHTADEALQQIKDKNCLLKFETQLGGTSSHTGRVLGVGIAYDRKTEVHSCRIEVLRERKNSNFSSGSSF